MIPSLPLRVLTLSPAKAGLGFFLGCLPSAEALGYLQNVHEADEHRLLHR